MNRKKHASRPGRLFLHFRNLGAARLLLLAGLARAESVTTSLLNTTNNPPNGWEYKGVTTVYSDKSIKLDDGGYVITETYPGFVTNLTIRMKGHKSGSDMTSTLGVLVSTDGETYATDAVTNILPVTSGKNDALDNSVALPLNTKAVKFKLALNKNKGGIGLFQVRADYVPGSAPPSPPVAREAAEIVTNGFTARWEASPGATNYLLSVACVTGTPPKTVTQGFDGFPDTTPEGWGIVVKDKEKVYTSKEYSGESSPSLKLQASGHGVTSPVFPAVLTRLSFFAKAVSKSNSDLIIEGFDGSVWKTNTAVNVPTTKTNAVIELDPADGFVQIRLTLDRPETDGNNIALDDVSVTYGSLGESNVLDRIPVGNVTNHAVSGLAPGRYRYIVRAENGQGESAPSGAVDVEVGRRPPLIDALPDQIVRVGGGPLTVELRLTETDGDPITMTNVTADTGTVGPYGLTDGVFTYTPAPGDAGTRTFTFSAADADGTNSVAMTVVVKPAVLDAVPMAAQTGSYTQDFSGLAVEKSNAWENRASPLPAWEAWLKDTPVETYSEGSTTGLKTFKGWESDPALGSIGANSKTVFYGFSLTNETETSLTSFDIRFDAAQRYVGGSNANLLAFTYRVGDSARPLVEGVWRRIPELCFRSPFVLAPGQTKGYEPTNAVERLSATLAAEVPPGKVLSLRWVDEDDPGTDQRFAIDDFSVAWSAGAVPDDAVSVPADGCAAMFGALPPESDARLPPGWRMSTNGAVDVSGAYADAQAFLTPGKVPKPNDNKVVVLKDPGGYAFMPAASADAAAVAWPAKAVGSVTLFGRFVNRTGRPAKRWNVKASLGKYRNGEAATAVQLLDSTDGAAWLPVGGAEAFSADEDNDTPVPTGVPNAEREMERTVCLGAPVADGDAFYLAWRFSTSVSAETLAGGKDMSAQAVGLKTVRIAPEAAKGTVIMIR